MLGVCHRENAASVRKSVRMISGGWASMPKNAQNLMVCAGTLQAERARGSGGVSARQWLSERG